MIVSKYEVIWTNLKKSKSIAISAKSEAHRRIKKAVIKRKDIDLGYKYLLSEANQRAVLEFSSEGHILRITLHIKYRSDWI